MAGAVRSTGTFLAINPNGEECRVSTVPYWSGREVRALREARRMSVREFAAHLGISDRMVSKWEAGGDTIRPRPLNQAALDTSLSMASSDVRNRFTRIAIQQTIDSPHLPDDIGFARNLVQHPVDDKLMTLVEAGPFQPHPDRPPIWLPAYYIDVHAITRAEFERFRKETEVPPENWDVASLLYGDEVDDRPRWTDSVVPVRRRKGSGSRRSSRRRDDLGPFTGVSREEALAYATWASKRLPTVDEWERAHKGAHAVIPSGIGEWCGGMRGVVRRGRSRDRTGFRCSASVADMLVLLAI
jgi:transcriptional regulator with XRE-family HTH domain